LQQELAGAGGKHAGCGASRASDKVLRSVQLRLAQDLVQTVVERQSRRPTAVELSVGTLRHSVQLPSRLLVQLQLDDLAPVAVRHVHRVAHFAREKECGRGGALPEPILTEK
jgi:hypothetical protein